MTTVACPLDCPDLCSITAHVEDGRIVQIDGNRLNPLTDGFICGKVRRFADHIYGADRLLTPAVRVGRKGEGAFRAVGWDEALDQISRALAAARDRSGGESILPVCYGGSNGYLSQDSVDLRLFYRLGASRLHRNVCAMPSSTALAGLYGRMPGVAIDDAEHAQAIVVWGFNPSASGIHAVPAIRRAQARGARLVVIDPRETKLARTADLHLALRPGTDLPVALAVIDWLFSSGRADADFLHRHTTGWQELRARAAAWPIERAARVAGIAADDLRRFAELYADASPALIRCGWGLERNRNGGSATAAILALPAVAGKFGLRGGGFTASNSGAWREIHTGGAVNAEEPASRWIHLSRVGAALTGDLDPRVEVLFVYNCNPLMTLPDQTRVRAGMARDDLFTVVFDQVMTDSALYADVILPATTFFEHDELRRGYGAMYMMRSRPAIDPVGESRPNYAVFGDLCDRLGLSLPGDPRGADDLADRIVDTATDAGSVRRALAADGIAPPHAGANPVLFVDVFPGTPDHKVHLVPAAVDAAAPTGLYGYRDDPATAAFPLALISPASEKTITSTLGQLITEPARVRIHPDDAAARGIVDGDDVRLWNDLGEVFVLARVTAEVRPGVVSLAKGLWARHTRNGATSNALCPDSFTDLGEGACYNDARVDIARAG